MIKKMILCGLLCSGFFINNAKAETVSPIVFKQNTRSPEYSLATSFFGGYVKSHPGTKMKTAAIDLNNDGIGEIAIQLDGPGTCNVYGCQTSILMHIGNSWEEIFHQKTKQIGYSKSTGKNMARLVDNNGIIWSFRIKNYQPDIDYMGNVINGPYVSVPSEDIDVVNKYYKANISWKGVKVNNALGNTFLLTSNDPYVNGISQGSMILVNNGKIILNELGIRMAVSDNKTNNVNDIIVSLDEGLEFFQWDGQTYKSVKTTFASRITPAP